MLVRNTHCDDERLRQLLEGILSAQTEAEVERHIETCDDCRRQLESLAAKEGWWRETRDLLVGAETAKAERLDRQSLVLQQDHVDPPSLTFLSPSDNPAMLGRLGEFEVLEFIGRGGMGVVLKGYDHELNRFVAIKVLSSYYAENGAARKRFAREAQAAAAVVHQHVVAIHAVDATHQPPYFVMSFVPGESLQQRLDREGPFQIQDVLRIGQQVAEGLAAAHAQGLVHRDIKPSNILLERNVERVLLTDFGLARAVDDASLTQSGIIAGTPQYMSPEQARGEALDHRADLFSLGSVLYALLSGHPPFRAESPYGVLRRVTDDDPRPLREINPAVPEWLDTLIRRLLAKHPEDRWQTAREVAGLLTQCLAHVQQPTAVSLPAEVAVLRRTNRPFRKYRRPLSIGGAVCAVLFMLLIPSMMLRDDSRPDVVPSLKSAVGSTAGTASPASPSTIPVAALDRGTETSWEGDHDRQAKTIDQRLRQLEQEPMF